jgi:hypothetical protein
MYLRIAFSTRYCSHSLLQSSLMFSCMSPSRNIVHYYIEKYLRVAWVTTYVGTVVLDTDVLPYPYVLGYVPSNQGVSGRDRRARR